MGCYQIVAAIWQLVGCNGQGTKPTRSLWNYICWSHEAAVDSHFTWPTCHCCRLHCPHYSSCKFPPSSLVVLLFVVVFLDLLITMHDTLNPRGRYQIWLFFPLFFCKDWSFLHNCWRWMDVFPLFSLGRH